MKRYLSLLFLTLVGCQSFSTRLTTEESRVFVALAKSAALASGVLTQLEKEKLESQEPSVAYYFLSRPMADYSVRWKLSDDEEIVISGRGDIFRLENAVTERKKANQPLQRNASTGSVSNLESPARRG